MGSAQSQSFKHDENLLILQNLEKIIFDLNDDNIEKSVEYLLKYFSEELSYSCILILSRLIYSYFISNQRNQEKLCFNFLQKIENKLNQNIKFAFTEFLLSIDTQESNYLLEEMVKNSIIDPKIIRNKGTSLYFVEYFSKDKINNYIESIQKKWYDILGKNTNIEVSNNIQFINQFHMNYEELSNNGWELHKQLIEEGVNPNEIAKIIRNDEIEKLQEISSQTNFDFNQTIEPSLYERCSFINQRNVTLIDYAAFFSAIKCFKFLLMNGSKIDNTGKYAIAGGNEEIIHLCEQNHSSYLKEFILTILCFKIIFGNYLLYL